MYVDKLSYQAASSQCYIDKIIPYFHCFVIYIVYKELQGAPNNGRRLTVDRARRQGPLLSRRGRG